MKIGGINYIIKLDKKIDVNTYDIIYATTDDEFIKTLITFNSEKFDAKLIEIIL